MVYGPYSTVLPTPHNTSASAALSQPDPRYPKTLPTTHGPYLLKQTNPPKHRLTAEERVVLFKYRVGQSKQGVAEGVIHRVMGKLNRANGCPRRSVSFSYTVKVDPRWRLGPAWCSHPSFIPAIESQSLCSCIFLTLTLTEPVVNVRCAQKAWGTKQLKPDLIQANTEQLKGGR